MSQPLHTGCRTLEVIANAPQFNEWLYSRIRRHIHGDVLEIGSGIGNISQYLLQDGFSTTLSDMEQHYIDVLQQRFSGRPQLKAVTTINLMQLPTGCNLFDTVIAINVIEHVADDAPAIKHVWDMLKPGGNFIVLVPAYAFLFCRFDALLGHYRRYTRRSMVQKLKEGGFTNIVSESFNLLGIAGWAFFGKMLGRPFINEGEMKLYNKLVPLAKLADMLTFRKIGLSVICIAQKK